MICHRLGIVGRGRAARSLVPELEALGHEVVWWWSRGEPGGLDALGPVDVILLAVSDDAVSIAARGLAERACAVKEVWLHLSGSRPASDARVTPSRPRAVGCLHPLQSLPGTPLPPEHLEGVVAALDGDPEAIAIAREIAGSLGMLPAPIDSRHKALYHAGAVSAAGHVVALLDEAITMLILAGFPRDRARAALLPLTRGALENLARLEDEAAAITGPISRGDAGTVRRHLEALEKAAPDQAASYRLLARAALRVSAPSLSVEAARALEVVLAEGT